LTFDVAKGQLSRWLKSRGLDSPGLNEQGLGGASIAEVDLFFDFRADPGTLKCSALIYRFRGTPRAQVVEAFRALERAGALALGGGRVDFEPESRSVFLSRLFAEPTPDARFSQALQALGEASIAWRQEGAKRVADQLAGF
jgi:hypothetical protein